jgi:transcriptional regulator with XRE-family HTH domain
MVTKYRVVYWEFDGEKFARHLEAWVKVVGSKDVAGVIGVSESTLANWVNNRYARGFNHPHLSNLLRTCNELSLDPREFFTTSE